MGVSNLLLRCLNFKTEFVDDELTKIRDGDKTIEYEGTRVEDPDTGYVLILYDENLQSYTMQAVEEYSFRKMIEKNRCKKKPDLLNKLKFEEPQWQKIVRDQKKIAQEDSQQFKEGASLNAIFDQAKRKGVDEYFERKARKEEQELEMEDDYSESDDTFQKNNFLHEDEIDDLKQGKGNKLLQGYVKQMYGKTSNLEMAKIFEEELKMKHQAIIDGFKDDEWDSELSVKSEHEDNRENDNQSPAGNDSGNGNDAIPYVPHISQNESRAKTNKRSRSEDESSSGSGTYKRQKTEE